MAPDIAAYGAGGSGISIVATAGAAAVSPPNGHPFWWKLTTVQIAPAQVVPFGALAADTYRFMCFWVYMEGDPGTGEIWTGVEVAVESSSTNLIRFQDGGAVGKFQIVVADSGKNVKATSSDLDIKTATLIVIRWDGTDVKIFADDVEVGTGAYTVKLDGQKIRLAAGDGTHDQPSDIDMYYCTVGIVTGSAAADGPTLDDPPYANLLTPDGDTADNEFTIFNGVCDDDDASYIHWDDWKDGSNLDGDTSANAGCDGAGSELQMSTLTTIADLPTEILGVMAMTVVRSGTDTKAVNFNIFLREGVDVLASGTISHDNETYKGFQQLFDNVPGGGTWNDNLGTLELGILMLASSDTNMNVTALALEVWGVGKRPVPPVVLETGVGAGLPLVLTAAEKQAARVIMAVIGEAEKPWGVR